MRRAARISCLLLLCLLGTGLQWDILQVAAWSSMVAGHAESMSLTQAVAKTFDGEMCPLCQVVAKAKQQSHNQTPSVRSEAKLLLFFHTASVAVIPGPRVLREWPADAPAPDAIRWAPPVPPPRGSA
ncbi:MAG TPA: hypothetical protein VGL42_04460 [Opitutaceae bacterium]